MFFFHANIRHIICLIAATSKCVCFCIWLTPPIISDIFACVSQSQFPVLGVFSVSQRGGSTVFELGTCFLLEKQVFLIRKVSIFDLSGLFFDTRSIVRFFLTVYESASKDFLVGLPRFFIMRSVFPRKYWTSLYMPSYYF